MPLITLTVLRPKYAAFKDSVRHAVHDALVSIGVPETDRFHRVLELSHEDFRFDPACPDVQGSRTDDFVLIEIVLSVGRSVKLKKQFLANLMTGLAAAGHNAENAMVVFKESTGENWAFALEAAAHVKR